jgi:DNA replication ATP-dependent helicase Dna2
VRISQLTVGPFAENCYLVIDEGSQVKVGEAAIPLRYRA